MFTIGVEACRLNQSYNFFIFTFCLSTLLLVCKTYCKFLETESDIIVWLFTCKETLRYQLTLRCLTPVTYVCWWKVMVLSKCIVVINQNAFSWLTTLHFPTKHSFLSCWMYLREHRNDGLTYWNFLSFVNTVMFYKDWRWYIISRVVTAVSCNPDYRLQVILSS